MNTLYMRRGGTLVLYIYFTRLAPNEIFSLSTKLIIAIILISPLLVWLIKLIWRCQNDLILYLALHSVKSVCNQLYYSSPLLFNQVATQLSSRGWMDPDPDLMYIFKVIQWLVIREVTELSHYNVLGNNVIWVGNNR